MTVAAVRFGGLGLIAISISPAIPGGLVGATTLLGIIVGAINGLSMGVLVLATERGRALLTSAVCAVLGGVAGVGALALARRPGIRPPIDQGDLSS